MTGLCRGHSYTDPFGDVPQTQTRDLHTCEQCILTNYLRRIFYARYAAEYISWVARGASSQQAYKCISFEIEAYAMEEMLLADWSDASGQGQFNDVCCGNRGQLPAATIQDFQYALYYRMGNKQAECDKQFP